LNLHTFSLHDNYQYQLTEVMIASSDGDRFHWHFTAGESTDS